MADELKIDIIVDEHGAVEKLAAVDTGVAKVVGTAQTATPEVGKLGASFLGFSGNLTMAATVAGAAVPIITALASTLASAAEKAGKFSAAANLLGEDASRIQALTQAAADNKVGVDQMTNGLFEFQERIASGKINAELKRLVGDLAAFKQQGVVEQFLRIGEGLAGIKDPLEQVSLRAKVFGDQAQTMGLLAKEGFRDVVDGAHTMRTETINELDETKREWDRILSEMKRRSEDWVAETFMGVYNRFKDLRQQLGRDPVTAPTAPGRPGQPEPLPTPGVGGYTDRAAWLLDQQLKDQQAITEEGFRQDEVFRSIARAQELIVKSGGDWSDVLTNRVSKAVDEINAKYVNAVMLNKQLTGGSQAERDRLMKQLTDTTNPNESSYDKRFNEIDRQAKFKLSMVDQSERESAAEAENAILEEMNLNVLQLQIEWEKAGATVDDHKKKIEELGKTYEQAFTPKGGVAVPAGLTMPTAEQIASHRYYGPVTPNGQPDPSRFGGAAPMQNVININANNSVNFEGFEELVRRVEDGLAQRQADRGAKLSR